ncbi:MAG: rRNA maturation RNAse YbeY, partial [Acidimicrobiales bacterium]
MTGPSVVATVDLDGEPDRFGRFDADRWAALALAALVHEGVEDGEVNLLFVGEAEMTRLNAEHMRRDGPTDVLSFPIDE